MRIGMIGPGKMGANMTEGLLEGGLLKGGHAVTLESGQQGPETETPAP